MITFTENARVKLKQNATHYNKTTLEAMVVQAGTTGTVEFVSTAQLNASEVTLIGVRFDDVNTTKVIFEEATHRIELIESLT